MEGIIETQYQIMQAMNQLLTNFKKDGPARKTPETVQKKVDLLDRYWAEFQNNHEKVRELEDPSHQYFAKDSYGQTRQFYNSTREFFVKHLTQEQKPASPVLKAPTFTFEQSPSPSTSKVMESKLTQEQLGAGRADRGNPSPLSIKVPEVTETATDTKTDEMLRKQRSNFKAFQRTASNINLDLLKEKWQFEDALKALESRWKAVDSLYWDIDSLSIEADVQYEMSYNTCELIYNEMKADINSKMWSVSYREKTMPTIEIPVFNGTYQHWTSFKDLFIETIHSNPSLSSAQRMQFLKSKVKGEAEKLIQHLTISSDNYDTAWEILNHRYNNKRLIFSSHANYLLGVPNTQHLSATSVKKLHDTTKECLNAIKNLGVDTWEPFVVHILLQKLDPVTHNDYSESLVDPRELPTFAEFLKFLESKFVSWESSNRKPEAAKTSQSESTQKNKKFHSYKAFSANHNKNDNSKSDSLTKDNEDTSKCPHCNKEHKLFWCKSFLELQPDAKRKVITKYNLCKNCLYAHNDKCLSKKKCRVCNSDHNTLLHDVYGKGGGQTPYNKVGQQNTVATDNKKTTNNNSNHVSQEDISEILLTTALIKVEALDGSLITLRALLDQGSQTSLITEKAAQMLRLPRGRCKGVIFGVGAKENNCKGVIRITCSAIHSDYTFDTDVFIMRNLINNLPNTSFTKPESWTFLENIKLADPDFNVSRPVDILLGADVYSHIIQEGIIRHDASQPVAQQTRLGWILCGNVQTFHCNVVINNIEDIQTFWAVEDIAENSSMSQDDLECLQHYKDTTTRDEQGRYVVELPFEPNFQEKLGASKSMALAQFRQLERKFGRQPELAEGYRKFIHEYQALNHMVECTSNSTPSCYLPHHCVQRADSTTTALRVVFNASAKTSTGYTLNDLMKRGPNLQQDLMSLILRWRQYQFAYTADIEKMYRQILCSTQHQIYQKILWRSSPGQLLREYQLTTVTYGMKAAPFLAMMTLKQLAADEGHKYQHSRAATALQEEFYMDDLVSGSFTLSSARQLQDDLIQLLQSGGFNLRKWSSNNEELLQNVNKASSSQASFDFKQAESTKTLGLKWHSNEDTFSFELKINKTKPTDKHTKRSLLSDISKIFDPLGWLAPVVTKLKLLFKQVWLSNIQWDDQLPAEISTEWEKIKADLQNISEFKISRWYRIGQQDTIQLHGFCDASVKAYACVVYCKFDTYITLVAAKTRLVPENKKLTLPRLELSGAHLLSTLMQKVQQALSGREIKVFGWSDSTAVLGWIQGDINRWTPFVANRVKQIKEVIPPENWYYIKSADNPADCASRGITVEQLKQHHLWWSGPPSLPGFDESSRSEKPAYVTDQEERKSKQSNVTTRQPHSDDVIQSILHRSSNMTRAVRVLAWVLRMTRRHSERSVYLNASELATAKHMIIKYVQEMEFSEEICQLRLQKQVHCKSKILCLNPFLDKDGLLRVGGRLKHANIAEEMKHPLIIPHSSHITDLIIDQAHRSTFHAGARMTLAHIRQSYWILGGNRAVKKRLHTCTLCKKHKAIKQKQMMGDLPEPRSNPSRPFQHTGVDFTGYVDVKLNKGRGVKTSKGYIAVFVCMVTKAVHLELVSDLSSTAFLAALKRMSSRRGKPHHIYSDNGTNFVGANKALQQELAQLRNTFNDEFHTEINEMGIQWHFNAPAWPSAGGLWEAAVKSLKHHLRRVVGEQKLTFEEYSTLLAQLEACLNSRPLCAITEDPDDLNYLTPSHFLSSGPLLTILDTEQDDRTRWTRTQRMFEDIWRRWQSEYLAQLSTRSKWHRRQENVKIGDVVIIHEPNLPAGRWALGRVIELHPGSDGLVRVVTLKTKNGVIKRPVIKLSVLVSNPISTSTSDQPNVKTQNNESKRRPDMVSNLMATLITLFLFLTSVFGHEQSASPYTMTAVHKALYFDRISSMQFIRDEWKLIVYYDMNPYWDGSATFEKYLKQINGMCETETNKALCDIILMQLRHSHDELKYYNGMLLNQHFQERTRKRRGLIDGVGYVANSLFGVLDQRFADQYKQDISLINENENHLALLWKNQTSVVEAEYNLLKRTEESINRQHKVINQHLNNLAKATNILNKNLQEQEVMNELALSTIIATNMLAKLKSIQDTLIDTITDIHHGMFSIHLLSPKQLRDQLSIISGQLSRELSLPIENIQTELPKIYHLLKVKARVTEQYLIFEIRIPLVNRESYDLYHLVSIPQQHGNTTVTVVPISDYIAINLRKDTYLAMTERDIQQCIQYDESTRLCHSRKPIFQFKSEDSLCIKDQNTNTCLTNIAACRNNWMELWKTNTYLYYCCGQCALRVICGYQITAIQVAKAGVIALDSDCVIKGEDFTVFSHKLRYSEIKTASDLETVQIAPINHIINVSVPQVDVNLTDHQTLLRHIKEQIDQMKSEKALNSGISSHDIHQYSAIYILMSGTVLALAAYFCRCLYRRRERSANLQSDSGTQAVTSRREPAAPVGPTPCNRDAHRPREEAIELRNFSSILSSIKRHQKTPPVFSKPVSSDSD